MEMMQAFWMGEITNPIMAIHELGLDYGYSAKKMNPLTIFFGACFLFIRIFLAPPPLIQSYRGGVHFLVKFSLATLCNFFFLILRVLKLFVELDDC